MRTTKKLLMVLVLAVVFVVALVATAFAAMPTGINVGDTENGWTDAYKSTYEDIDNPDNGWIFYTTASGTDPLCRVQAGAETTTLVNAPGGAHFYYNKALKKGVVIAAGEVKGNSGDANEASLSSIADANKTHYAFFIVDNWTTIENHFATKTDIWSKGTNGVTLPTNLEETATKSIWATIYVSKSNYEAMKAAFATIDADDSLDSTAKRRAKAAEAKNYSTFYNNKNVPEEGALWTLGYLFKLMAQDPANYPFEVLEIRGKKGVLESSLGFQNFGYTLNSADSVQTIYIDSRMASYSPQENYDRGLFRSLSKLKSLGHVVYEDYSGAFKTDVSGATFKENSVILTGFTKRGQSADHQGLFAESKSITNVVWFETLVYSGTEISGTIPSTTFSGTTALTTLTIPATVELKEIKSKAFENSGIKTIYVNGTVASGMVIDKEAFNGATSATIQINVCDTLSEINMKLAVGNAGLSAKIEVVNKSSLKNPIIPEGFQFRIHEYSGLRSIFTLDASVVLENGGVEKLKDYGVITFTEKTLEDIYSGNLSAVLLTALGGEMTEEEAKRIRKVSVMEANRFVEVFEEGKTADDYMYADAVGDKTFCITLTNIPDQNVTDAVYSVAYSIWNTDNGGTDYSFTIYESENEDTLGKQAYSLYDVTIYAFANGIVNTETVTDEEGNVWQCCLWDVLDNGAVPYEGNIQTDAANAYDQTKTHFLRNELYAYYSFGGYSGSSSTLENTSSTNVLWSVFEDGDNYVAVYHKGNGEGVALLPGVDSTYDQPFSSDYKIANAKTPAISSDIYKKINTLVIDYGIEGVAINGDGALASMPYVETIVYPNGFDEIHWNKRDLAYSDTNGDKIYDTCVIDADGDGVLDDGSENNVLESLLADNSVLKDIIWANNDKYAHMKDFIVAKDDEPMEHLFDMRGMGSWTSNNWDARRTFYKTPLIENVVFGASPKRAIYTEVFADVTALQRAWHETEHKADTVYDAPAAKTIALYKRINTWQWGNIEGAAFKVKSNGYTIILHSSFAMNCAYTASTFFGANDITVKMIAADDNGNPVDPTTLTKMVDTDGDKVTDTKMDLPTWICYKIKDTSVTNRIFIYDPTTKTYKNPAGIVFAEPAAE